MMQKQLNRQRANRAGFTLLELLIVLAIIVVIAAMVVPNLIGQQDLAKIQSTKVAIAGVEQSLDYYKATAGSYIQGGDDILEQMTRPWTFEGRQQPPSLKNLPLDPWGNPLHYQWPNQKDENNSFKPALWSNGPDGKNDDGGGDDINN